MSMNQSEFVKLIEEFCKKNKIQLESISCEPILWQTGNPLPITSQYNIKVMK